jgi:hypothetical protein
VADHPTAVCPLAAACQHELRLCPHSRGRDTDKQNLMAKTYSDLHELIQDKFNEAGVEIMSSHYSNVRDGNRTTIPETYLPRDYVSPSFRLGLQDFFDTTKAASHNQEADR